MSAPSPDSPETPGRKTSRDPRRPRGDDGGRTAMTQFCLGFAAVAAVIAYAGFPADAAFVKAARLDPMAFAILIGCLAGSLSLYPGYRLAGKGRSEPVKGARHFVTAVLGLTVIVCLGVLLSWLTR